MCAAATQKGTQTDANRKLVIGSLLMKIHVASELGLIGLGVMGRNLALNLLNQNRRLTVYSYATQEREFFANSDQTVDSGEPGNIADSLPDFVSRLKSPRIVLIMVTAGEAVDTVINDLLPLLSAGDILIDGGNSHYKDTMRRESALKEKSLYFIGAGISGGEEGARHGASLMVGGNSDAFSTTSSIFATLSTKVADEPCYGHMGSDGAGHFVKMVHNGIEYGVMQLIAESYYLLKHQFGYSNEAISQTFAQWNQQRLRSYLIGITADIFSMKDDVKDGFLIDVISDRAGQKGTGRWTVDAAMELGVPLPGIIAAVTERQISGLGDERRLLAVGTHMDRGATPVNGRIENPDVWQPKLENTLYISILTMYLQGLHLIEAASQHYSWQTDLTRTLKLWRGGCIIRADLLKTLLKAVGEKGSHGHLLLTETMTGEILPVLSDFRDIVSAGIEGAAPLPAMTANLNYLTSLQSSRLPLNLIAAQRDYFGAHTYERTDQSGVFHTQWDQINNKDLR